jgi:hypothetical protein
VRAGREEEAAMLSDRWRPFLTPLLLAYCFVVSTLLGIRLARSPGGRTEAVRYTGTVVSALKEHRYDELYRVCSADLSLDTVEFMRRMHNIDTMLGGVVDCRFRSLRPFGSNVLGDVNSYTAYYQFAFSKWGACDVYFTLRESPTQANALRLSGVDVMRLDRTHHTKYDASSSMEFAIKNCGVTLR